MITKVISIKEVKQSEKSNVQFVFETEEFSHIYKAMEATSPHGQRYI